MRRLTTVLLAAGLGFAASAQAEQGMTPFASVDAFLTLSDLDVRFADSDAGTGPVRLGDDDIGAGMRMRLSFGNYFFLRGGFQSVRINNPDTVFEDNPDVSGEGGTVRFSEELYEAGLKWPLFDSRLQPFAVIGEYRPVLRFNGFGSEQQSSRLSDSGMSYGGGVHLALFEQRWLHLSAAYRLADDLGKSDYDEILLGVALRASESLGVFVEYRMGEFDFEQNEEGVDPGTFDVDEFRFGLRFSFGGEAGDDFY